MLNTPEAHNRVLLASDISRLLVFHLSPYASNASSFSPLSILLTILAIIWDSGNTIYTIMFVDGLPVRTSKLASFLRVAHWMLATVNLVGEWWKSDGQYGEKTEGIRVFLVCLAMWGELRVWRGRRSIAFAKQLKSEVVGIVALKEVEKE